MAGGIAGSSAAWIAMTAIMAMIGTATGTGAAASGSERGLLSQIHRKAAGIRRLFAITGRAPARENRRRFAGHRGVALLNDALLRRLSGSAPGA
jgi:hypothetical protein